MKVATPQVAALLGLEAGVKAAACGSRSSARRGSRWSWPGRRLPLELAAGTDLASPNLLNKEGRLRHHLQAGKGVRFQSSGGTHLGAPGREGGRAALPCGNPPTRRCSMWSSPCTTVGPSVAGDRHRAAGRPARDPRRLPLHLTERVAYSGCLLEQLTSQVDRHT